MVNFFDLKDKKRAEHQPIIKTNTVRHRREMISAEIDLYKNKITGKNPRVDANSGLPPSLPKKVALLY